MTRLAVMVLVVAACGSSDSKSADAPAAHDSPPSAVQMVTCPATPAATVTTSGFMYAPMSTTISQGQVVKFVMPAEHNAAPGHTPADSTLSDSGLNVDFGATTCLMFTQTGMYGFHCTAHSFNGTIVVQ
jgi:plastocyanin